MAEGRSRAQWEHTSMLAACICNIMRTSKFVSPSDLNPYTAKSRRPVKLINPRLAFQAMMGGRRAG